MDEIGAIGDVIGDAALSRAVEPRAGEVGADGHTHERQCLNCGAALVGEFCHACGQHAHVHRTIGAFFHDLAHGVLHFEGKTWNTLPMLALRPGALTRRYIDGQRARFVSPIALFLFSVFLMFAAVSFTGNLNPTFDNEQNLAKAEQNTGRELTKLQARRAARPPGDAEIARIDAEIKDTQESLDVIRTLRGKGVTEAVLNSRTTHINSDIPWVEEAYNKAKKNPQLLIYKLKTNSYKWSWALIPLSVPFLWLMFPFSRRFRTYDHVVFVTYSLSFMSLLVVVGSLVAYAGIGGVAVPLLFIPPIHMFLQLRGAYGLGLWGALWRTAGLLLVSVLVLSLFVLGMIALGVLD